MHGVTLASGEQTTERLVAFVGTLPHLPDVLAVSSAVAYRIVWESLAGWKNPPFVDEAVVREKMIAVARNHPDTRILNIRLWLDPNLPGYGICAYSHEEACMVLLGYNDPPEQEHVVAPARPRTRFNRRASRGPRVRI